VSPRQSSDAPSMLSPVGQQRRWRATKTIGMSVDGAVCPQHAHDSVKVLLGDVSGITARHRPAGSDGSERYDRQIGCSIAQPHLPTPPCGAPRLQHIARTSQALIHPSSIGLSDGTEVSGHQQGGVPTQIIRRSRTPACLAPSAGDMDDRGVGTSWFRGSPRQFRFSSMRSNVHRPWPS
jgi:hypothetical protein